jgi:chemotaxis methyl-accepting protein methylase
MGGEGERLQLILEGLREKHGIDFSLYRRSTVERRLGRRMNLTRSRSYGEYFSLLERNPHEYDLLLKCLTIKVSRFFRNKPLFDLLSDEIFPEIMAGKKPGEEKSLRIWSAGCSHGEEAYSVAITLLEWLRERGRSPGEHHLSIFATDIDEDALCLARKGEYAMESLREADREIVDKYFAPVQVEAVGACSPPDAARTSARYRLIEPVLQLVCFCKHDLASQTKMSPPAGLFSNYDLILCRNVLIYFSKALQERAFFNLWRSLNPGGYLVLGRSEAICDCLKDTLVRASSKAKVYRKVGGK